MLRKTLAGESHEYGDGWQDWTMMPCPLCNSNGQQKYLERICGLSDEMRGWLYENTTDTDENGEAFDHGKKLAKKPFGFYTLTGPNGVGKTRLLACLVNAGRSEGWTSVYTTMAELLDDLRVTFASDSSLTYSVTMQRVVEARILAIDECDRFSPTPWAKEKIFQIIDERYRNCNQMCTAFATNAGMDSFDGYIASRMRDRRFAIYELGGGDWRK